MTFSFSPITLINILIISIGIGVCGLSFLQVTSSTHLRKEVRRYFQLFFILILIYIITHLARELMNGLAGEGLRIALYTVTFVEILTAGFMTYMMSRLVLTASRAERPVKLVKNVLLVLVCIHAAIMVIGQFTGLIFYFDAANVYHRAPGYLLSNLCPFVMMILNIYLLVRYRKNYAPRVRRAFWTYMIAPIAAMLVQGAAYGVQFIILATMGAAVYMFSVIIRDQNEQFEAQKAESSRIEAELNMASDIQANMLPNIFPAFPDRPEFDVYASMNPAKEVGGDFYDFFLTEDGHLGIVMADVSGKGVPAALFMMVSKILLQNTALSGRSPKEILEAVNDQICMNNPEEMFVTVWLGLLDLTTGSLVAANAGHEYPVLKQADGSFELVKDRHGLVIGAMEGARYQQYELQMEPGSKLFLYTDGVAEATNANNELFGTDRMVTALRAAENQTPQEILKNVDAAVAQFVGDAPQFDDLTMLCLQFNGKPEA